MPLFAYFAVVGSVLLGLLYVADARFERTTPLSVATNFHGLPAPYKAPASVPILTVRDAPAPDVPPIAVVAQAAPAAEAPAPAAAKPAAEKPKVAAKSAKNARTHSKRNAYAQSAHGHNAYAQGAAAVRRNQSVAQPRHPAAFPSAWPQQNHAMAWSRQNRSMNW
jgi:hypothetical protein